MKKIRITLAVLLALFVLVGLVPAAPWDGAGGWSDDGTTTSTDRHVAIGSLVSQTGVEYPVWEQMDSNGDVVAAMTVICTDLTDGSQDCIVKIYEMVAGTLTNQGVWP